MHPPGRIFMGGKERICLELPNRIFVVGSGGFCNNIVTVECYNPFKNGGLIHGLEKEMEKV
jgi:hypothetical protein